MRPVTPWTGYTSCSTKAPQGSHRGIPVCHRRPRRWWGGDSGLSQGGERHPHSYPLQLIDDKKLLSEKCEAMVAEIRRAEQRHHEQTTQVQEQHQLVSAAWGRAHLRDGRAPLSSFSVEDPVGILSRDGRYKCTLLQAPRHPTLLPCAQALQHLWVGLGSIHSVYPIPKPKADSA